MIEAHGTGTPLGDPIEISSISSVANKNVKSRESCLHVFGLKGNIGHTESTAGVANVIKAMGLLERAETTPNA